MLDTDRHGWRFTAGGHDRGGPLSFVIAGFAATLRGELHRFAVTFITPN